ncbi:hypothetical protein BGZ61DRAFT_515353 [Ilyonectria robusta]|uniref:uncharacterized protein n=1 Tax=Ilyonectria robusta TaxID=1079257 RepID=UPI001E8CA5C8|nr:uncharacterized protein BGZ61DRAFT_515353 [Ilyonectria robusta]KAH8729206.1 hypothetical protein BGZ61DRAFT_515353 [Ilyonectria robusta]
MASTGTDPLFVEACIYLGISIIVIGFRTFCRTKQGGFRNLQADDYLMLILIIPLSGETFLGYTVGTWYHGLTNSGMTDEQRAALSPDSDEYKWRVGGSKNQVIGWSVYTTVMWIIKASMCAFYLRLTAGLMRYKTRVYLGFAFIVVSYIMAMCCILFSCQPMHKLWQINPYPGNLCTPAVNKLNVYMIMFLNLFTDIYLIMIPIPMLLGAQIARARKAGLVVIFSGGIFVIVAGLLRSIFILQSPITGPRQAATWAVRETFVAVITSNLPLTWGWMRQKLKPLFGSLISSDKSQYKTGPEPGSIMLGDRGDRRTWRSQQRPSTRTTITSSKNDVFIHADEASSDQINPPTKTFNGITKEVEFEVSSSAVPDSGYPFNSSSVASSESHAPHSPHR